MSKKKKCKYKQTFTVGIPTTIFAPKPMFPIDRPGCGFRRGISKGIPGYNGWLKDEFCDTFLISVKLKNMYL